jgi:hypothetical protein
MGDLHQPLHCADDNDRRGNEKEVRFKMPGRRGADSSMESAHPNHVSQLEASTQGHGTKIKLHALWDGLIEIHTEEDPRELANELEKGITAVDKASWSTGDERIGPLKAIP